MSQKCHTMLTSPNFFIEPTIESFTQTMKLDLTGAF